MASLIQYSIGVSRFVRFQMIWAERFVETTNPTIKCDRWTYRYDKLQIETSDIYVNFLVIGQLQRFEMII